MFGFCAKNKFFFFFFNLLCFAQQFGVVHCCTQAHLTSVR